MTTFDLLCAIGEADESFVEEAADSDAQEADNPSGRRFGAILRWGSLAAAFLILIGVAWLYADGGRIFRKKASTQEFPEAFCQESAIQESATEIAAEEITSEKTAIGESCVAESIGMDEECVETVLISSFQGDETVEMTRKTSDDLTVENGCVFTSYSLNEAVECYGDQEEYRYRVFVELFQDGCQIANDGDAAKSEMQRLIDRGYVVVVETIFDGETTRTYFTLRATAGQVKDFAADAKIGYALWLYDERAKGVQAYE